MQPSEYPIDYYSFEKYNTKQRMLTYWHQISEILALKPTSVLEIGVGTGLVSSYLRHTGVQVTTLDINPKLKPDHVGSVLDLRSTFGDQSFDTVLCARVLHHVPFSEFSAAMSQIHEVSRTSAIVSLPHDDLRLYFMTRYTSSTIKTLSLPFPVAIKHKILQWTGSYERDSKLSSGLWQIQGPEGVSLSQVKAVVSQQWEIVKDYRIPEDSSHYLLVLRKR